MSVSELKEGSMVARLRNVNPFQCAIVSGILYALIGVIAALFLAPVMSIMTSHMPRGINVAPVPSMSSLIFLPIIYAILGFISGIATAFFYNLVARWTGGIEVTLDTAVPAVSGTTLVP